MPNVPYPAGSSGASDPICNAVAVTPSDTVDLAIVPRVLFLSAPATVRVQMVGGGAPVAIPLEAGMTPIRVTRIYATGTTAGVTIIAGW